MEPIVAESAHRHGVATDDTIHAFNNPVWVSYLDEGLTMVVGPRRDGQLIEVGFVNGDLGSVIVHSLYPARTKFLREG